ncbi:MAG TPA: hypothetical protein VHC23_09425 [Jatrophihabitans sp.]|nr:hypothetical protein [Jatrophihabitans sp.]
MYRKVLVGGLAVAAVLGAGGTAMALTASDTTSGHPDTTTATATAARPAGRLGLGHHQARLRKRLTHAQIVTKGKNGFVTHDLIKGTVTAVSATSITVQAADRTSETFAVGSDTKVRVRSNGSGAASSIAHVAKGDQVFVAGTGTSTLTAKHVLDVKK